MVVTLTFSPCIDKSTTVASMQVGKKMRCANPGFEPGGGGINVARVLKRFGADVTAVFPCGGYSGAYFKDLMKKEGVHMEPVRSVNSTRENFTVYDEYSKAQYRFIMPAPAINESEWRKCVKVILRVKRAAYIVASGSLAKDSFQGIFAELSSIAQRMNARLIIDTSGESLRTAIHEDVFLIKPNLSELASLAGKEKVDISQVPETAREIINRYKCKYIVVSLGEEGAILVSSRETYSFKTPQAPLVSTVGAGDSMVGGIVYSLSRGLAMKNALAFGVACGTAATMNPGTGLCKKSDAEILYSQIMHFP